MTPPEIPDEAVTEMVGALWDRWGGDEISQEGYEMAAPVLLAAVWPHLYAAALRHAADTVECQSGEACDMGEDCGYNISARDLRRMADEATR